MFSKFQLIWTFLDRNRFLRGGGVLNKNREYFFQWVLKMILLFLSWNYYIDKSQLQLLKNKVETAIRNWKLMTSIYSHSYNFIFYLRRTHQFLDRHCKNDIFKYWRTSVGLRIFIIVVFTFDCFIHSYYWIALKLKRLRIRRNLWVLRRNVINFSQQLYDSF